MIHSKLRIIPLLAIFLFAVLMLAPPLSAKETTDAKTPVESKNEKAALVNGKVISHDDFNREYEVYKKHYSAKSPNLPDDFLKRLRAQVVNEMVNQELLYQASQKQKVNVSDATVEKEVANFQKRFPEPNMFQKWLESMRFTEDEFKAQFTKRITVRALVDKEIVSKISIKDEEAKTYFDNQPDKFHEDESVRARHILIKLDKTADDKAKAKARKELLDIKKKILAGEDFVELAKSHSQGPSAPRGGDLGYFKRGQMVKPFDMVAFKLAVNEVSDIVETQFGYHLIKVLDHKKATKPKFEEVKKKAKQILRNERIQKEVGVYIQELRKEATIETFVD